MIKKVWAMYFSGTGNTEKLACHMAEKLAELLPQDVETETFDFTPLAARSEVKEFEKGDVVILGTPVIAGRVPNLLVKYLNTIKGNGALGVPLVTYGNRNFDDALMELRNIMQEDGFFVTGGAAFVGQHTFATALGAGRPDAADLNEADKFIGALCDKIAGADYEALAESSPVMVDGSNPVGPYYQPRDRQGNPIDIRKAKPKTSDACDNCGLCARLCPLGSINPEDCREIGGICMKCGACIRKCPQHAKYYDDRGLIYHKTDLEDLYGSVRAEDKWFI